MSKRRVEGRKRRKKKGMERGGGYDIREQTRGHILLGPSGCHFFYLVGER